MGEQSVARGGLALYSAVVVNSVAGFLFWVIVGRVLGASGVGAASALVSAAGVAVVLVSAGLQPAVIRETAARGEEAVSAALALALLQGLLASLVALILAHGIGASSALTLITALLAMLNLFSVAVLSVLVGLEGFRAYVSAQALGALSRLGAAALLVPLLGAVGALLGFSLQALVAAAVAGLLMLRRLRLPRPTASAMAALLALQLSNYMIVFSNQVAGSLGTYLFQLIRGAYAETGGLYISLMVAMVLAAVPGSLLGAALPVYLRSGRGAEAYTQVLRIGLHAATPLAAAAAAAPATILGLLGRGYSGQAAQALTILAATVPLAAALQAAVTLLNHVKSHRGLLALGAARLTTLLTLLPLLSSRYGVPGAAAAMAASTAAALLAASTRRQMLRVAAGYQAAALIAIAAAHTAPIPPLAAALLAAATALLLGEAMNPGTTRNIAVYARQLLRSA